jgi:hypothetical protein
MKTQQEYHYTYYSYEEWGRGYFGSRTCKCLPEEDINYFGSFSDKNFKPTQKIILKSDYSTRAEAYVDEIILQKYYKVIENPHFVNKAYQTSTKFYFGSSEHSKKIGLENSRLKRGCIGMSLEQQIEMGKRQGKRNIETGQISNLGKEWGKKAYENKLGAFSLSRKERSFLSSKIGKNNHIQKIGIFGMNEKDKLNACKKGAKTTLSQRWMCTETNHISTPGGLSNYQKARNIDTTKRVRLE